MTSYWWTCCLLGVLRPTQEHSKARCDAGFSCWEKLWHKVIKRRQRVNKLKQAAEIAAVAEPCHSSSASLVQNDADCYVSSVVCFCCSAFAAIATQHCVGDEVHDCSCVKDIRGHQHCSSESSEERKKSSLVQVVHCRLVQCFLISTCVCRRS